MTDDPEVALSSTELAAVRETLAEHGVRFAVVFGSATRPDDEPADIDLAVEFELWHPTDNGYADIYLALYSALDDRLDKDVDLVDVHSMSPQFASVVFDGGVRIYGTGDRERALEEQCTVESPSVGNARERVAAAIDRLREAS